MGADHDPTTLERLAEALAEVRAHALATERDLAPDVALVDPAYRASARNLLHYLALRQHDLREVQPELTRLGLSSLGRSERASSMPPLKAQ